MSTHVHTWSPRGQEQCVPKTEPSSWYIKDGQCFCRIPQNSSIYQSKTLVIVHGKLQCTTSGCHLCLSRPCAFQLGNTCAPVSSQVRAKSQEVVGVRTGSFRHFLQILFFWNRVTLCSPGWHGTSYVITSSCLGLLSSGTKGMCRDAWPWSKF